jgi:hypothetical protein
MMRHFDNCDYPEFASNVIYVIRACITCPGDLGPATTGDAQVSRK